LTPSILFWNILRTAKAGGVCFSFFLSFLSEHSTLLPQIIGFASNPSECLASRMERATEMAESNPPKAMLRPKSEEGCQDGCSLVADSMLKHDRAGDDQEPVLAWPLVS